jgi:hypothetical protein
MYRIGGHLIARATRLFDAVCRMSPPAPGSCPLCAAVEARDDLSPGRMTWTTPPGGCARNTPRVSNRSDSAPDTAVQTQRCMEPR